MKTLPDKSIDLFICDLPYGQIKGKGSPWDTKIDLAAFWTQVERLMRDEHTPVLHFCTTRFGVELINSKPTWFSYDLVWNKQRGVSFASVNRMPMRSHEMIYVFSKSGCYYNRVDIKGEFKPYKAHTGRGTTRTLMTGIRELSSTGNDGTTRCALSIIDVKKMTNTSHPTEKPQELYEWLIERYGKPGGTLLDPTAGSFNSVIVAKKMGMNGIGIEMNEKFFWDGVSKLSCIDNIN